MMENELHTLLERARNVTVSEAQLEEGRIAMAAANAGINDSRVTVETMRATRTIMLASEQAKDALV
ncbi:MAG: hypothetical protein ACI8U3_000642 [Brevundimonas sp.]|jgi:hypothetical protein